MSKVVHFDLAAVDPERAIAFYSTVFGWKFDKWDGPMDYWLITAGPEEEHGIGGGLFRIRKNPEELSSNLTIGVDDVDAKVNDVVFQGGSIYREKSAIPGIGWLVYIYDTEGNILGLMQNDPKAR